MAEKKSKQDPELEETGGTEETGLATITDASNPMVAQGTDSALDDYSGYEDFDQSDLIIPRIKLVQPTSRTGTPGKFIMNLTDEEFSEMDIVVIKATRSRIWWSEDLSMEDPLCKSNDFMSPDSSIDEPPSLKCAEYMDRNGARSLNVICEKAKWLDNNRPDCNQVFNILCLSSENMPFWMSLSGSSIAPIKRFISVIALQRKKLWQFQAKMTAAEIIKPNRHYVVKFSKVVGLGEDRLPTVTELVTALHGQSIQTTQASDTAATDSGDAAPF